MTGTSTASCENAQQELAQRLEVGGRMAPVSLEAADFVQ